MSQVYGQSTLPLVQHENNISLYALQSNLLRIWTQKKVDKYYQTAMLAYMDNLPQEQAKKEIIRQNQRMLENKSQYNIIKQYINHREEVLDLLQQTLEDQNQIEDACQGLDQLRKINLKLCQCIFAMKQSLQSRGLNANAICQGYNQLFKNLNNDNANIVNSYLRKYISFGKGFDPFLLVPYQRIQKNGINEQTPKCVTKLFKMNISYVYRLIKCKNQIVKCLSCACLNQQQATANQEKYRPKPRRLKQTTQDQQEEENSKMQNKSQTFEKQNQRQKNSKSKLRKPKGGISQPESSKQSPIKIAREKERENKREKNGQNDSKQGIKLPKIQERRYSNERATSGLTVKRKIGYDEGNGPLLGKSPIQRQKSKQTQQSDDEIDSYRKKIIAKRIKIKSYKNPINILENQKDQQQPKLRTKDESKEKTPLVQRKLSGKKYSLPKQLKPIKKGEKQKLTLNAKLIQKQKQKVRDRDKDREKEKEKEKEEEIQRIQRKQKYRNAQRQLLDLPHKQKFIKNSLRMREQNQQIKNDINDNDSNKKDSQNQHLTSQQDQTEYPSQKNNTIDYQSFYSRDPAKLEKQRKKKLLNKQKYREPSEQAERESERAYQREKNRQKQKKKSYPQTRRNYLSKKMQKYEGSDEEVWHNNYNDPEIYSQSGYNSINNGSDNKRKPFIGGSNNALPPHQSRLHAFNGTHPDCQVCVKSALVQAQIYEKNIKPSLRSNSYHSGSNMDYGSARYMQPHSGRSYQNNGNNSQSPIYRQKKGDNKGYAYENMGGQNPQIRPNYNGNIQNSNNKPGNMYYNGSPGSSKMPNTNNWEKYPKNINSDRGYDANGHSYMQNSSKYNNDSNSSYDNMNSHNSNKSPYLNNNNYQYNNRNNQSRQNANNSDPNNRPNGNTRNWNDGDGDGNGNINGYGDRNRNIDRDRDTQGYNYGDRNGDSYGDRDRDRDRFGDSDRYKDRDGNRNRDRYEEGNKPNNKEGYSNDPNNGYNTKPSTQNMNGNTFNPNAYRNSIKNKDDPRQKDDRNTTNQGNKDNYINRNTNDTKNTNMMPNTYGNNGNNNNNDNRNNGYNDKERINNNNNNINNNTKSNSPYKTNALELGTSGKNSLPNNNNKTNPSYANQSGNNNPNANNKSNSNQNNMKMNPNTNNTATNNNSNPSNLSLNFTKNPNQSSSNSQSPSLDQNYNQNSKPNTNTSPNTNTNTNQNINSNPNQNKNNIVNPTLSSNPKEPSNLNSLTNNSNTNPKNINTNINSNTYPNSNNNEQKKPNNTGKEPNYKTISDPNIAGVNANTNKSNSGNNDKPKIPENNSNQNQLKSSTSSPIKRQIQLKPQQTQLSDLYSFIQMQKISNINRTQFQVGQWRENIKNKHSYLTKFFCNSQLSAFGISSPRIDGDYHILYWGVIADSPNGFLFKKYIEYLEKFTSLDKIYISSNGYNDMQFVKQGPDFMRKRSIFNKKQLGYQPFLSIQCSNIHFNEKSQMSHSTFYSEQIQDFKEIITKTSVCIGLAEPEQLKQKLPNCTKWYTKLDNIGKVNKILEQIQADTYAANEEIATGQCKLIVIKDNLKIKKNQFYVRDGYFMTKGCMIYENNLNSNGANKNAIYRLQLQKQGMYMYFGKKFQTIHQFITHCTFKVGGPEKNFAFKMFTKQLYGRMKNSQYNQKGCYGNWDIDFIWQDQLKGTIIKPMPENNSIFGPQNYFIAIYKMDMLLYGFQVNSNDFLL